MVATLVSSSWSDGFVDVSFRISRFSRLIFVRVHDGGLSDVCEAETQWQVCLACFCLRSLFVERGRPLTLHSTWFV